MIHFMGHFMNIGLVLPPDTFSGGFLEIIAENFIDCVFNFLSLCVGFHKLGTNFLILGSVFEFLEILFKIRHTVSAANSKI